jgi:hypothetical protein
MKKIKSFNIFINEKLGVLTGLDDMSRVIIDELSNKNYFKYKTKYLDKNITIHCFKTKDQYLDKELSGSFSVEDASNFEFKIKISDLTKSTIIHELKHMDRVIRRDMKTDTYHYINHVGRYVAKKYTHLFIDKESAEILIETFYYCNPDEFEAYYQNIYSDIKDQIDDNMTREQKIETIKELIEKESIYIFFKHYYNNEFRLEDFFKSKEDCNYFLNDFFYRQELFFNNQDDTISNLDTIKSWFKSNILNKFLKDDKLDGGVKEFNYYINKIVKRNYPKFSRLYSLFI